MSPVDIFAHEPSYFSTSSFHLDIFLCCLVLEVCLLLFYLLDKFVSSLFCGSWAALNDPNLTSSGITASSPYNNLKGVKFVAFQVDVL
jgi:hypothetical protein